MNKNQKGFTIIEGLLILLVIGIIGGLGWYVSKQNNEKTKENSQAITTQPKPNAKDTDEESKSGYKTYTDQKYKFSFKYPSNWKLKLDNSIINMTSPDYKEVNDSPFLQIQQGARLRVTVGAKFKYGSIYDYRDAEGLYGVDDTGDPNDTKDIQFMELDAVQGYECGHPSPIGYCLEFIKDHRYYSISFDKQKDQKVTDNKYYPEYQKLLDSFQFN